MRSRGLGTHCSRSRTPGRHERRSRVALGDPGTLAEGLERINAQPAPDRGVEFEAGMPCSMTPRARSGPCQRHTGGRAATSLRRAGWSRQVRGEEQRLPARCSPGTLRAGRGAAGRVRRPAGPPRDRSRPARREGHGESSAPTAAGNRPCSRPWLACSSPRPARSGSTASRSTGCRRDGSHSRSACCPSPPSPLSSSPSPISSPAAAIRIGARSVAGPTATGRRSRTQ